MSCMCPRSSLRAYVVGRVRGPCCGMLYIFTLVPGLAAIHFCSGAGACCYTLLALVPGLAAIHFYSGAGACCYTFLMLWDVFGAHVVGRVRGLCCGTCSGPMLWDVFRAHVVNVFGASFP